MNRQPRQQTHPPLTTKLLLAAFACVLLSCSKNPKGFVGVWQMNESGLFSNTTIVLELSKDGTCGFSRSGALDANVSYKTKWSVDGKKLVFNTSENESNFLDIMSHSETELVLREPESGKIVNYRRVSQ